jgi:hypothetical protein
MRTFWASVIPFPREVFALACFVAPRIRAFSVDKATSPKKAHCYLRLTQRLGGSDPRG